jgi:mRNA-degrading endonuclease toxin of MazEF toxin-antitoxin module
VIVLLVGLTLPAVGLRAEPPPDADEAVARLVAQLGHDDFAQREAAQTALDALGPVALEQLRAARRARNPEIAQRAGILATRIEWRVANEKTLAPTLVSLTAEDAILDAALADLSKQSGYMVVLGGPTADTMSQKKVTVKTGSVPFWKAVQAVCDVADLRIVAVGGFLATGMGGAVTLPVNEFERRPRAPGSTPPLAKRVARQAQNARTAIILESRGATPKRPMTVYGAICVEAFPLPEAAAVPTAAAAVLQVWPEPKLNWEATRCARVDRATDTVGQHLAGLIPPAPATPQPGRSGRVVFQPVPAGGAGNVILRNRVENEDEVSQLSLFPAFTPNVRQALVMLKPGGKRSPALANLVGAVWGNVRSEVEPLATGRFGANRKATASGMGAVELRAELQTLASGQRAVLVDLSYNSVVIVPAHQSVQARGMGGGPRTRSGPMGGPEAGIATVFGITVADAEGRPYDLLPIMIQNQRPAQSGQVEQVLLLQLPPKVTGLEEPRTITFWGTYSKPVEVPFTLSDVPLTGGTP